MKAKKKNNYSCLVCGETFSRFPSQKKGKKLFCSHSCYWKWLKGKPSLKKKGKDEKCSICGEFFYSPLKSHSQKFCSQDCYWKSMKGKEADWLIPFNLKEGHTPWLKGKKMSEEYRKRRRESKKLSGQDHPNWRGGISFEPYGPGFNKQLREEIRKRDKYRCQECFRHQDELFKNTKAGAKPYKLAIHHIDYDKKNNNPNNLISLCMNCHMQTNFSRENWTKYFKR
jgi:hypothetical protein